MQIIIKPVNYSLPNPPSKLNHKKMNIFEWFVSLIISSHVCQICGRKEIWSVSSWHQIDNPIHKDSDGGSVVCDECWKANPLIFTI